MAGTATYAFHRCLGRGGFGEVYLATQRSASGLEKKVAIKLLQVGLRDQTTAVQRLRDEGRMLAMLDHPAILGVHEMTRIRGRIALVTQYIEGTDLSHCCRVGNMLPPRVAMTVTAEVAGALHTAWTTPSPLTGKPLRLVHRDIKPENIRLSKHGEVKLLDFGIARSHEMSREARTAMGDIPFTPGYAAPEAFIDGIQDGPTDTFALGATLYRALRGERYYQGIKLGEQVSISANRARYVRYLAERLRALGDDLHPDLVPLLRDMLAWNPEERPTADQVQQRAETIADEILGPTPKRWARLTEFPEAPAHEGGELLGLELQEDDESDLIEKGNLGKGSLWDATTQKLAGQALVPDDDPKASQAPPPPRGLASLKPTTVEGSIEDLPRMAGLPTALAQPAEPAGPGVGTLVVRFGIAMLVGAVFVMVLATVALALGLWAGT